MKGWIVALAVLGQTGCAPLIIYELVEYRQAIADGKIPSEHIARECAQQAMTTRSARNDGTWDVDAALLESCYARHGWQAQSDGTWRRL